MCNEDELFMLYPEWIGNNVIYYTSQLVNKNWLIQTLWTIDLLSDKVLLSDNHFTQVKS